MREFNVSSRVGRWLAVCLAVALTGCGSPSMETQTLTDRATESFSVQSATLTLEAGSPKPSASPTLTSLTPSLTPAKQATTMDQPTPTVMPLTMPESPPALALGEDCRPVEHLDPDSVEARRIVAEFERAQARLVPFDPLVFEDVYEVSRQDGYLLIAGLRYEVDWIWAGTEAGDEITPLGAFVPMNGVSYSRFAIHDYFSDVLPDAPPALFGCSTSLSLPLITGDDPALIIDPTADCSQVERPDPTQSEIQHFVPQMATVLDSRSAGLLSTSTAWQVGDWIFISATFANAVFEGGTVDGAFLVRPPNDLLFSANGGIYSRRLLMREIYQAFPEVPRLLLSCAIPVVATHLRPLIEHGYYAFPNKAVWERTPRP